MHCKKVTLARETLVSRPQPKNGVRSATFTCFRGVLQVVWDLISRENSELRYSVELQMANRNSSTSPLKNLFLYLLFAPFFFV